MEHGAGVDPPVARAVAAGSGRAVGAVAAVGEARTAVESEAPGLPAGESIAANTTPAPRSTMTNARAPSTVRPEDGGLGGRPVGDAGGGGKEGVRRDGGRGANSAERCAPLARHGGF
jgi:hypothetical protein